MALSPRARRAWLAVHLAATLGWMGAVAAFAVLDVATVASPDGPTLRAAYIAMDLVARFAILPLALASLGTGVLMGLGTSWGLLRHHWVVLSLALTALATLVLAVQLPGIAHRAAQAADPSTTDAEVQALGNLLLHSLGGLALLAGILVLNVAKPRGLTRYGWRRQQAERRAGP